MPNQEEKVLKFFKAVTATRRQPAVVPFWAQPFGSMGRYLAHHPLQQWISSTICCLFRYHDQHFIRSFLSFFLIIGNQDQGQEPPRQHQMSRMPEKLRLDPIIKKVVESTWLHIANVGLLRNDNECPRLPAEFDWACIDGHNIDESQLAALLPRIARSSKEIIIQSKHLLTNLVLWLSWHHAGRLRVIVSGKVIYDRLLGSEQGTVECRVDVFCEEDRNYCSSDGEDISGRDRFRVFENIAGNLRTLFRGHYSGSETQLAGGLARQNLYEWPYRYPKGEKSIQNLTWATAREPLRWFLELPIAGVPANHDEGPSFHLDLTGVKMDEPNDLRVGDLLGRSPMFLNMHQGSLGRPCVVVFSADGADDSDLDLLWDGSEDLINGILVFFPILRDLVDELKKTCVCWCCDATAKSNLGRGLSTPTNPTVLQHDENCLAWLACHEVMFCFSHGIADAFGAPDASGARKGLKGDLGGWQILRDVVSVKQHPHDLSRKLRGTVQWSTMFGTALSVFLGVRSRDLLKEEDVSGP